MMRYDLDRHSFVLQETKQRIYDEELSNLSEGMDRAAQTTFALKRIGNDLVYGKNGQWLPYTGMLLTGLEVAKREATNDPRRSFLVEMAETDLQKGMQMRALKPGERLSWFSAYRQNEADLYGDKFMIGCGFKPARRLGFIYQAVCQEDGSVLLQTQTVDGSDLSGFEAAMSLSQRMPEADLGLLTYAYDQELSKKYGGEFFAGRRGADMQENVWREIIKQRDLIEYFMDGLEIIAKTELSDRQLEEAAKKHVYGVWALFKKRIDGEVRMHETRSAYSVRLAYEIPIAMQVRQAFNDFVSEGRVMIGCGGAVEILQGRDAIMNADGEDVFKSIFGEKKLGEDKFGPLNFKCPKGHWNKRPPATSSKDFLSHCKTCRASLKC
jgi:hypothetical protein